VLLCEKYTIGFLVFNHVMNSLLQQWYLTRLDIYYLNTLNLLLSAFGCHSNRSSPRVEKICIPSFFKMISLKQTKNAKKNQF